MKRVVVVGTSAGGIDALRVLVAGLPATFPAAICVVIHMSPESPGVLPDILLAPATPRVRRATASGCSRDILRCATRPPSAVEPGHVLVTRGPREHGFRPAIDPLFRSAAQVYGPACHRRHPDRQPRRRHGRTVDDQATGRHRHRPGSGRRAVPVDAAPRVAARGGGLLGAAVGDSVSADERRV